MPIPLLRKRNDLAFELRAIIGNNLGYLLALVNTPLYLDQNGLCVLRTAY